MIKMIQGVFGYKTENGRVIPKTPADDPFSLSKEQESRLVNKKVAVYVVSTDADEHADKTANTSVDEETLKGMKYNDLKKLAKELGVPAVGTSEELIAKILDAKEEKQQTNEPGGTAADDEEPPVLQAADPE